ncbi:MAG: TonB-dependent receptor, partial [Chlorobium sp.]|nr:TonB-dependent receptor [Chlorobium sp.]
YMNAKNTDYKPSTPAVAIDSNPDPEWLPMRPEHTASVGVTWKPVNRLALNLNGRYVGEYKAVNLYTNTEGNNYPGDFIVFNAGAKYKITDNIGATFLCNNIGNVQYEEAEWFRAPGRSFVAGMDFTF